MVSAAGIRLRPLWQIESGRSKGRNWQNHGWHIIPTTKERPHGLESRPESHPQQYESWFSFANTSGAIKKYPQAISAFKKTIKLKPEEGLGKVGLAFAYFGDEKPDLAIEALKDAMQKFKANKNISWYRDCRLAIRQIKDFARFPPKFAELWLKNNLKRVQETFENSVLDFVNILKSD